MNSLHLLLADDAGPALPDGADAALLDRATLPEGTKKVTHLFDEDRTNDLAAQRWAVVYPEGRPELLDLIGPLMSLREQQQRAKPLVRALGPEDDGRALYQELYDGKLPYAEQPRYVLLLGDLDEIAAEVQIRLGGAGAIGRLAFDRPEDYRAYADKAVAWDGRELGPSPRTLLYGAYDPYDGAMRAGEDDLLSAVQADLESRSPRAQMSFGRKQQTPVDGLRALLASATEASPSVLLTVTHGLGSARWGEEERRKRQGALRITSGVALEAELVRDRPFLPGGLWALFACFGAGTPHHSRFDLWLRDLVSSGALSGAPNVLGTLAAGRPFVSALPKAALANPEGPLGVLGHIDLAWGWSFRDEAGGGESRAMRFAGLLTSAANGDRFGLGTGPIGRALRGAGHKLAEYTEKEKLGTLTPEDRKTRGHDWMTWHDLGAWILLGDPAARLPLTRARAPTTAELLGFPFPAPPSPAASSAAPSQTSGPDVLTLESLVLAKLAGEADVRARAEAMGVSWPTLRRMEQAYTEAGRKALAELSR